MRAVQIGTVLALLLVTVLVPVVSSAATSESGAFVKLPRGEQKVARALFEAQTTSGTSGAPKSLTLDEIAERRHGGSAWGDVFREMKARGLLTEKSLGEVVTLYERRHRGTRTA